MIVPVTMPDAAGPIAGVDGSLVVGVVAGVVVGARWAGHARRGSRAGVPGTRAPNRLRGDIDIRQVDHLRGGRAAGQKRDASSSGASGSTTSSPS